MIFIQHWANPGFAHSSLALYALLFCYVMYSFWRGLRSNALHALDGTRKPERRFYFHAGAACLGSFVLSCVGYFLLHHLIAGLLMPQLISLALAILLACLVWLKGYRWLNKGGWVREVARQNLENQQTSRRSHVASVVKFGFYFATLVLLMFALMRPQGEEKASTIQRKGIDVVFLLDLSRSMEASDVPPSRLTAAKGEMKRILDGMQNDHVGLILFTGDSYAQSPLTSDKNVMRTFIRKAEPSMMPSSDTLFAPAIWQAFELFEGRTLNFDDIRELPEPSEDLSKTHRVIVIFSDGEDHQESIQAVLEPARKLGVRIDTVGIGTAEGAGLFNEDGSPLLFMNQPVITRLNEANLQTLASRTGGEYLYYTHPGQVSSALLSSWQNLQKRQIDDLASLSRVEFYPVPLLLSLVTLAFAVLCPLVRVEDEKMIRNAP